MTYGSFIAINHRQAMLNRVACRLEGKGWEGGMTAEKREIGQKRSKKEKERVRQKDWFGWRNKSLLSRVLNPSCGSGEP